jgi:hypothetical protein
MRPASADSMAGDRLGGHRLVDVGGAREDLAVDRQALARSDQDVVAATHLVDVDFNACRT